MSESEEENQGVKIVDRRRFNTEGEAKASEDSGAQEKQVEQNTEAKVAQTNQSGKSSILNSAGERVGAAAGASAMAGNSESSDEDVRLTEQDANMAPLDFSTFIMGLAHQALILLGQVEDPYSGQKTLNMEGARQTIDTIAILEEKTRGNLTGNEEKLITEALAGLRMAYVEVTGAPAAAE